MIQKRILIVEDEPDVAELVRLAVERGGEAKAEIVGTGDAALRAVDDQPPDLMVLDLSLPVLDGLEVCRILRSRPQTQHLPIVILTARNAEDNRVLGLDTGADDYITKPFSPKELAARVRAVLRRARPAGEPAPRLYRSAHLTVDLDGVVVSVDGETVRLTRREFGLLHYLVLNKGRVVSRDRLLERVWGYDNSVETRSVDVHVGRLRAKLGPAAQQIETIIGLGYRFND
jgi:DNA-binding response OmpR family regulator